MPVAANKKHRFSYADYLTWNDGKRWEIIDGIPYAMSPAPSRKHQYISGNLFNHFKNYLKGKKCKVYSAPFDIRLAHNAKITDDELVQYVLQPDVLVYCNNDQLDQKGGFGAPDLVIEIISEYTFRKDAEIKKSLYEEYGVREYWLIDPIYETVTIYIYSKRKGKFGNAKKYERDKTIGVHIFPDLRIDLNEVFEE
jgi:Uma2 family endonuclease